MWPGIRRIRSSIVAHDLVYELLIRVLLLLAVCILQQCVKPHKRFIREADLLIYYGHPRQPSIVPAWATVFIVICLPLMCFALPEYLTGSPVDITHAFLAWTLALSVNAFITEVMKLITGRPRPDFFYRCYPDGQMNQAFISLGETKDIWEGRKSFPSGHSSFTFCSMGFVSAWLCGRLGVLSAGRGRWRGRAAALLVCLLPMLLALGVAVSRCCDNHHHWEDVLVGSILGLIVSYVSYNQYFYNLESELSGTPLPQTYRMTENISREFVRPSQTECSTKYLSE